MRHIQTSTFLLLAVLSIGALGTAPAAHGQEGEVIDEIVAVVGDRVILRSEVDGLVVNVMQQQQATYSEALWKDALQQLIDQQVMSVVAQRDTTIKITDDQVQQALDQRVQQLTQQVGSEARLEELYGKSILQIKADLREEFRSQMAAEQLQQRRLQKIRITPSEVQEWFAQFPTDSLPTLPEMVRVSHVVRYPEIRASAKQQARDVITTIRDSIVVGGASLEEMARQFSDDPGSAAAGGRIENTTLSDLVPEFAAMAARAPIGEVSQVFETPFGFHILRVNERRGDVVDFNHILIRVDETETDPTEAIAYLELVRDSIVTQDAPFALMAKRHSEEESTASIGGRVMDPRTGDRSLIVESLGPTWQRTLDTLQVGEVSEPSEVELLNGRTAYHIVLLQRRTPAHRWDIATDYERIEQYALQEKRAEEVEEWLEDLREEVYIDLRGKARALTFAEDAPSG